MDVATAIEGVTSATPLRDVDGRTLLATILKLRGRRLRCGETRRARRRDRSRGHVQRRRSCHGVDPKAQLFARKPGTDVVLLGHGHARGGATYVDVSLRVGRIAKTVRAHGLRVWQSSAFGGVSPGPARPIREPVPLIYELAWGGQDLTDPLNYSGRGVTRDPKSLIDTPAARLEYPDKPIGARKNVPAAFSPIHRHWQPRVAYAGTYDEAWMEARMPLLPADFDDRFNTCVPLDQWSELPLPRERTSLDSRSDDPSIVYCVD